MILLIFILFFAGISTAVVLLLANLFFPSMRKETVNKILIRLPVSLCLLIIVSFVGYDFVASPMTVRKYNLKGDYVINRNYFKGENADWQYDHYRMSIQNDTLYLYIMNNDKLIKTYKRKITYIDYREHTFIRFYDTSDTTHINNDVVDSVLFRQQADSVMWAGGHEALKRNPLLKADPFSFNILLRSERFGNMFFTKGQWKPREKKQK